MTDHFCNNSYHSPFTNFPKGNNFCVLKKQNDNHKTLIKIGNHIIGSNAFTLIAGPCAIENYEDLVTLGSILNKLGVTIFRGSAYKPRSSPYSFQGKGIIALKWHKEAQKEHKLPIETEVLDTRDVEIVSEHVDIIRIGARNMHNYSLLKEVAKTKKPIILKRSFSATLKEWLLSAEYIMSEGNSQIILCERGIRSFESSTRFTLDLCSVAKAKQLSHLPIIVDPSHASGERSLVPSLALASTALDIDGLCLETHLYPEKALCDSEQALFPGEIEKLILQLHPLLKLQGKYIKKNVELSRKIYQTIC